MSVLSEAVGVPNAIALRGQLVGGLAEHTYDEATVARAVAILRDVVRDKSYELLPIGQDVAMYLRHKRKRLTPSSLISYESCLDKFARYFGDLHIEDLEPPRGTVLIEEFMDHRWGNSAPRTYNANLSMVSDFLKFMRLRGRMERNPVEAIERAKKRQPHRTTFNGGQIRAIIAGQDERRDRIALRLLLNYALRKGALRVVQFKHFDHQRKQLTIFTKGQKIRTVPLPDSAFWMDLERHILDIGAAPNHFLMARQKRIPNVGMRQFPKEPMGGHGLHSWWYRCLANAGIVPEGTSAGEHMHKARHTAGQQLLNHTGNLKAVQKLLGHESISTTADHYVDWDLEQLTASLASALGGEES